MATGAAMAPPPRLLSPALSLTAPPLQFLPISRSPRALISSTKCDSRRENAEFRRVDPIGRSNVARFGLPGVEGQVEDETCELVSGTEIVIGEGGDSVRAYLMKAVKNNNGNGVLLLSDELGFEDSSIREFAYRVACSGYNVLLPDLFRGNPWKMGQPSGDYGPWAAAHPQGRVSSDIARSAEWLEDEFIAAGISKKLGIIGFGFGSDRLIETLAGDELGRFGTGVWFYGSEMGLGLAHKIRVPLLIIGGDADPLCPVALIRAMEGAIARSKAIVYEGRGQGFAHRPASQDEDDDAEDAFALTRSWLHEFLHVD